MHNIISSLLEDKKSSIVFSCFGIYHLVFIIIVLLLGGLGIYLLKNKKEETKLKVIKGLIIAAFSLYMLDFFLMPFAYGEIDVEKLPYHVCTAMCVGCFISRFNTKLYKFRFNFALIGFISNLVYFIYPAGVMWYQVSPFSYRVIQTLTFHSIMMIYGLYVLIFEVKEMKYNNIYKDIILVGINVVWALSGNIFYNGLNDRIYNWLFVYQDPFYLLPVSISPYIMPFIVLLAFSIVISIVYVIYNLIKKQIKKGIK